MSDPDVPYELCNCEQMLRTYTQEWRYTHLWSKGVDDLTREGLCELGDEEKRELSPWNRRVLALVLPMGVVMQEGSLLVGLSVSYSHGEGRGKGGERDGGEKVKSRDGHLDAGML